MALHCSTGPAINKAGRAGGFFKGAERNKAGGIEGRMDEWTEGGRVGEKGGRAKGEWNDFWTSEIWIQYGLLQGGSGRTLFNLQEAHMGALAVEGFDIWSTDI